MQANLVDKAKMEKELMDIKSSFNEVSVAHSICLEKSRIQDG